MEEKLTQIVTLASARILDLIEGEYEEGWLTVYKRQKTVIFHDAEAVSTTTINGETFYCAPYASFLFLIATVIPGVASNLVCWVEQSDDQVNWYKLEDDGLDDIGFQNGDGDQKICISGVCRAPYIRVSALASAGTWTLTSKMIFNS